MFAIAGSNVRRMLRERSNIFFVFIFPLALILLIGAQFGGDVDPGIGLYQADRTRWRSPMPRQSRETLDGGHSLRQPERVGLGGRTWRAQAGVFLPAGKDQKAEAGEQVEIGFRVSDRWFGPQVQQVVAAAVSEVMTPVTAAQFGMEKTGASFDDALAMARSQSRGRPRAGHRVTAVGEALFPSTLGRFDLGASSQLVLFVFLTALAGSAR